MNIRRGLFRLWLVFSLVWIVAVGTLGWSTIQTDRAWQGEEWWEKDPLAFLPVRCEDARGVPEVDYSKQEAFEPWNRYRSPSSACYYKEENFRRLYPAYSDLSADALSTRLYQNLRWAKEFEGDRYEHTKIVATTAFAPPIVLLIVGGLVFWAVSGFRSADKKGGVS